MAFSTLPREQITEGAAVFTMVRNFGSSLFISLAVLMFLRTRSISYSELAEFINPFRFAQNAPVNAGNWNIDSLNGLLQISGEMSRQAAMVGYINAFMMMAIAAAVSIPLSLLLKRSVEPPR